ncbi:MAG: GNAT family protein [Chloroflexota bacterium]
MILGLTERLILRPFQMGDLETFLTYRNDPAVARYQGWKTPYTREQAINFINSLESSIPGKLGDWYQVALEIKGEGKMIGDCAFRVAEDGYQAEIGYSLVTSFHGQGYGTEAAKGLLNYLFTDLDMHRVSAFCDTRNAPSYQLLERVGFRLEGHLVENYWDNGEWASEYHYAMLKREWAG